jgi:hypothetical protein
MINLTPRQLRQAADIKERIDALESKLNELFGGEVSAAPQATEAPKKKRKLSARGLANIRAGVAKRMAAQGEALAAKPVRKRKLTAAGRAALSAAAKARWAKAKKAGKVRL